MASRQQLFINETKKIIKESVSNINVYDTVTKKNADLPFIVLQVISDVPKLLFDGDIIDIEIQINCYGKRDSGMSFVRAYSDQIVETLKDGNIIVEDRGYGFDTIQRGVAEVTEDESIISIRTGFRIR